MKVSRRHDRVRMRLDTVERELLSRLFDELSGVFETADVAGAVLERLFPSAHREDPAVAAEHRELTHDGLLRERTDRLGQCRAELLTGADLELDDEAADRWLTVINDLRLSIGTAVGITAEDAGRLEADDPLIEAKLTYHWLTELQDSIIRAVMR